ncbi:hypothetical protein JCM8547_008930 [Rhodosporidiobolus lusitaniae]
MKKEDDDATELQQKVEEGKHSLKEIHQRCAELAAEIALLTRADEQAKEKEKANEPPAAPNECTTKEKSVASSSSASTSAPSAPTATAANPPSAPQQLSSRRNRNPPRSLALLKTVSPPFFPALPTLPSHAST